MRFIGPDIDRWVGRCSVGIPDRMRVVLSARGAGAAVHGFRLRAVARSFGWCTVYSVGDQAGGHSTECVYFGLYVG